MATKPWLSGNMLPNIKTCENGFSNSLENMIFMALKLLQQIVSYHQIYQSTLIFYAVGVRCDRGRFS